MGTRACGGITGFFHFHFTLILYHAKAGRLLLKLAGPPIVYSILQKKCLTQSKNSAII